MELGVKAEELLDPNPDIYELFNHYNSLYFDNALGSCIVYWTRIARRFFHKWHKEGSKRASERQTSSRIDGKMYQQSSTSRKSYMECVRSAGMFCYKEGAGCEIRLSENVLKFSSVTFLKKTLLHEMIHAYLYITSNKRDRSYHGPGFHSMLNAINSSSKTDPQRPDGGYNITLSHGINKEADSNRIQNWICTSCGDLFEGSKNREPSADDCIENMARDKSCGNFSCHWHAHKIVCSGTYVNTSDKPGYKDKLRVPKGSNAQEIKGDKSKGPSHTTRQTRRTSRNVEHMKDTSNIKKPNSTVDDAPASSGIKSPSRDTHRSQSNVTKNQQQETVTSKGDALTPKLHKRPRTTGFTEDQKIDYPLKENAPKRKRRNSMSGQPFAFYANEESDEDIKPLVNKRTERRKWGKLLKLKESLPDAYAVDIASSGPGTTAALAERSKARVAPPVEDKVIYILDD